MEAMNGGAATLALNNNWLDTVTAGGGVGSASAGHYQTSNCIDNFYVPYTHWSYPVYISTARPIKLTLSEVDRLRKLARTDKALKSTLEKFTPLIEVTVDFD